MAQVFPVSAHQAAFQKAVSLVTGNGGAAPSVAPLAIKFARLAALYGLSASVFRVRGGAAATTIAAQFAPALAEFETAFATVVAAINA